MLLQFDDISSNSFNYMESWIKDWILKKPTTFVFGQFTTFLAVFCLLHKHTSQNLGSEGHFEEVNVSKSQLIQNLWHKFIYKCSWQVCFSILEEKKIKDKCFKNGHFLTICGHFLATLLISLTKLRFKRSFWGAQCV